MGGLRGAAAPPDVNAVVHAVLAGDLHIAPPAAGPPGVIPPSARVAGGNGVLLTIGPLRQSGLLPLGGGRLGRLRGLDFRFRLGCRIGVRRGVCFGSGSAARQHSAQRCRCQQAAHGGSLFHMYLSLYLLIALDRALLLS